MATARKKKKSTAPPKPDPSWVGHGLLIPIAAKVFDDLRIGSSLWQNGEWYPIHEQHDFDAAEEQLHVADQRYRYNDPLIAQAWQSRQLLVGTLWGLSDLFVPIVEAGQTRALIVAGPVATASPGGPELLEYWRQWTGHQGSLADPSFLRYVSARLDRAVLDGDALADLKSLVQHLASAIVSEGDPERTYREVQRLKERLRRVRFAEKVWEVARQMIDERTSGLWADSRYEDQRPGLRISAFPRHAAVGLIARPEAFGVDALVRQSLFQRACVGLAAEHGDVLAGRLGYHGVFFLSAVRGPNERASRTLVALVEQARNLARRRFGFSVRFGVSALALSLPAQYQAALAAAERALTEDVGVVQAEKETRPGNPLSALRRDIVRSIEQDPQGIRVRFERLLEAVAVRTAQQVEPARAHLESLFERMAEGLVRGGALDPKGLSVLEEALERKSREAVTLNELFAVYRGAVDDLVQTVQRPVQARHERSFKRAEEYLREHYTERVTLAEVARAAGFAPTYFSTLYRRTLGVTFERHLVEMRLSRAKDLLTDTSLNLQRVAQLSGFSRATYLSRVFKASTGETPVDYRFRALHRARRRVRRTQ